MQHGAFAEVFLDSGILFKSLVYGKKVPDIRRMWNWRMVLCGAETVDGLDIHTRRDGEAD